MESSTVKQDALAAARLEIGDNVQVLGVKPFDPEAYSLSPSFRLTSFSDLKG